MQERRQSHGEGFHVLSHQSETGPRPIEAVHCFSCKGLCSRAFVSSFALFQTLPQLKNDSSQPNSGTAETESRQEEQERDELVAGSLWAKLPLHVALSQRGVVSGYTVHTVAICEILKQTRAKSNPSIQKLCSQVKNPEAQSFLILGDLHCSEQLWVRPLSGSEVPRSLKPSC